jgi:hypothetical protein
MGARVRRQHRQEDMQQRSEVSDNGKAPGMEPDDDWWEQLVHPPQLHCISQASRQGGLGGKLGLQQQQRILQKTWGESRWEKIICGLQQEGDDPVTPSALHWTQQE